MIAVDPVFGFECDGVDSADEVASSTTTSDVASFDIFSKSP